MPDWKEHLHPRLAPLRLSPAREAEIIEELSQHLDERYEELRVGGAGEADARRLAIAELLEPDALALRMRSLRQARVPPPITPEARSRFLLGDLWQDLRYAARMLRKQPGFAAAAVLTLALGIGANSAIFALVDATLLQPLPYPQAECLVAVWGRTAASARGRVAPADIADWNARTRTFQAIGGFRTNVGGMVLAGADGAADTVPRQWVGVGIFDALGLKPAIGRTFLPSDVADRRNVVVLSDAFWRSRFNADPSVIGRALRLDGDPWTVVGVVPKEAQLIGQSSIWALERSNTRGAYLYAIGRLKPGVTLDAASADLNNVVAGLAREFPATNTGRSVAIEPLHDVVIGGELRRTSMLFVGVVGFVLLICCANVANLLLTRATVRRRELAIRSALGAGRSRVIRQLLTESLVLSACGGVLGLAVGAVILNVAPPLVPEGLLPAALTLSFDLGVIAFCAAASLAAGVIFGLAPAWQARTLTAPQALASNSRTVVGRGGTLLQLFVVAEVATAVLLLCGAVLLLRTLSAVESVDRGYRADDALTMIIDPPFGGAERLQQFYAAVEREVRSQPGVRSVAWATTLPFGGSYQGERFFEIVGDPPLPESQRPAADKQIVSPSYFDTLDLPIVSGRGFTDADRAATPRVCLVNEALARAHLAGKSPLGQRIATRFVASAAEPSDVCEIVGVVRQVKRRPDEREDFMQIYVPLAQETPGDTFLLVRPASGPASALAPAVRAAIGRVDRDQEVSVRAVTTLDEIASEATERHRFRATLVGSFAALALLLAMVGLFGVLAYSIQQRVRDFGVRRALGAGTSDVLRLVAGSAVRVIATGAAIGLTLSAILSRLLATMLFGVQPLDPMTFASVTIVLALTAAVSTVGPAWRATRIDPAVALRGE